MHVLRYVKIIRAHRHPGRFLLGRLLVKSGACRLLKIRQDGYCLRFHPSNLSEQLFVAPHSRLEANEFFRAYLKTKDQVIDVGANIGDTALISSIKVGPDGKVWAIEPHPRTYRFLLSNLKLNRAYNVVSLNYAVGNNSGEVTFADDRRDDMNRVGLGTLHIPLKKLDDLVKIREPIALLKVDVEGYEKPVFEGASEILKLAQAIHFEVSQLQYSWYGYEASDVFQLLISKGFLLFRLHSNECLEEIDTKYIPSEVENIIGLKDLRDFQKRTNWLVYRK